MEEKELIKLEREYARLEKQAAEDELMEITKLILEQHDNRSYELAIKYSQLRFEGNIITLLTSGYGVRKNHKIRRYIITWHRGMRYLDKDYKF